MAKILIVDDSNTIRLALRKSLQEGGHEIVEGADGLEGLNAAKDIDDINLVICDFNMPNMNGLEMAIQIMNLEKYQKLPIFILTTETTPELKKNAAAAGVKAWIQKPIEPTKLLRGIEKVLSTQQSR